MRRKSSTVGSDACVGSDRGCGCVGGCGDDKEAPAECDCGKLNLADNVVSFWNEFSGMIGPIASDRVCGLGTATWRALLRRVLCCGDCCVGGAGACLLDPLLLPPNKSLLALRCRRERLFLAAILE